MKFTLPWLKEHLATAASLADIVDKLTMLGLEVEEVTVRGADLTPFRVAKVVDVRRHPNAERLSVCRVDTGDHTVEVVCGAPNVHAGMKAIFAPVGATFPGHRRCPEAGDDPRRREQRHAVLRARVAARRRSCRNHRARWRRAGRATGQRGDQR